MKVFLVVSSHCEKIPVEVGSLTELYELVKGRINWNGRPEHENVFWALAPVGEKMELTGEGGELTVFPMTPEEAKFWDACMA